MIITLFPKTILREQDVRVISDTLDSIFINMVEQNVRSEHELTVTRHVDANTIYIDFTNYRLSDISLTINLFSQAIEDMFGVELLGSGNIDMAGYKVIFNHVDSFFDIIKNDIVLMNDVNNYLGSIDALNQRLNAL